MRARKLVGLGLSLASCALLAGGCGSDSDGASTGAATGSSTGATTTVAADAGIQKATEQAAFYREERSGMELPALSKRAPGDLDVAIATCPIPACNATTDGAEAAAKELGWNVDYRTYELTPESYQKTIADIAQDAPDAFVWISAFPNDTIEPSLRAMADAGTAIVQISPQAGETPSELVPAVLQGRPFYLLGGEVAAYEILADAGAPTNATVVFDPSYGVFQTALEGFEKTMGEHCPKCTVDTLEVSLASPAPQQMSQVTNYLSQHPDVEYLFFTVGDQAAALPEALAAAGLTDQVQYVTLTAGLTDLQNVKDGKQLATIQNENFSAGFGAIDAALRILVDGDPGVQRYPEGYTRILTEDSVVPGELPTTPGTPDDYLEAWGLGG